MSGVVLVGGSAGVVTGTGVTGPQFVRRRVAIKTRLLKSHDLLFIRAAFGLGMRS